MNDNSSGFICQLIFNFGKLFTKVSSTCMSYFKAQNCQLWEFRLNFNDFQFNLHDAAAAYGFFEIFMTFSRSSWLFQKRLKNMVRMPVFAWKITIFHTCIFFWSIAIMDEQLERMDSFLILPKYFDKRKQF